MTSPYIKASLEGATSQEAGHCWRLLWSLLAMVWLITGSQRNLECLACFLRKQRPHYRIIVLNPRTCMSSFVSQRPSTGWWYSKVGREVVIEVDGRAPRVD
ncbi:hypothetical protein BJX76DRAFT_1500 [Aspergillus varians]